MDFQREIAVDSSFPLPAEVSHRQVADRHLLISVRTPAWVVMSDKQYVLFELLHEQGTIRSLLEAGHDDGAIKELIELLFRHNFIAAEEADPLAVLRVQAHITNKCNLRCKHCYVSSGHAFANELSLEEWKVFCNYLGRFGQRVFFSISGGEPLAVPWLVQLVRHAHEHCGFDVSIITNGTLANDKTLAALRGHIRFLVFSFDGPDEETHDHIRGKDSFVAVVDGLHRAKELGVKTIANIVLRKGNVERFVKNAGAFRAIIGDGTDIDIAGLIAEGRGVQLSDEMLSQEQLQRGISGLAKQFLTGPWRPVSFARRVNCGFGTTLVVYANGNVSPCLSPRFIIGNVKEQGSESVVGQLLEAREQSLVDRYPICATCDVRYLCGGRCHLHQLRRGMPIKQNDCTTTYRDAFYAGLVKRFDLAELAFGA